jgi:LmbE family N-acetylglucosaminyl deacetylase
LNNQRRLLCVFAHPDDESYGPGGSIAKYALEGVAVYLLTFTCGEAGSIGVSKDIPNAELCRLRTSELAGACDALGVKKHRILGVPDGKVEDADEPWAVSQIVDDIHGYRPQVLITFHHQGISGHRDHIAVAGLVAKAFDAMADDPRGPQKLYEYGIHDLQARYRLRKKLYPLQDAEIDATVSVPDEAMERKLEAIRRHKTQYDFFLSLSEAFDYSKVTSAENFHLRKTRLSYPAARETDLFSGISASS